MKALSILASVSVALAATSTNAQMFNADEVAKGITVVLPENADKAPYPTVFFLQGSGGRNERARKWSEWFKSHGVASVLIDNAGLRSTNNIGGTSPGFLANDYYAAVEAIKSNPRIDLARHAVMGFSLGATASLVASEASVTPKAIFALYPGTNGSCRATHGSSTQVFIFYGDKDDWGNYQGHRDACRKESEQKGNVKFYLVDNAGHGFDSAWTGQWRCCNSTFNSASNPEATEIVKARIVELLTSTLISDAR